MAKDEVTVNVRSEQLDEVLDQIRMLKNKVEAASVMRAEDVRYIDDAPGCDAELWFIQRDRLEDGTIEAIHHFKVGMNKDLALQVCLCLSDAFGIGDAEVDELRQENKRRDREQVDSLKKARESHEVQRHEDVGTCDYTSVDGICARDGGHYGKHTEDPEEAKMLDDNDDITEEERSGDQKEG